MFKSSHDMVISSCIQEAPREPGGKLRSNVDTCYMQGRDRDAEIGNGRVDTGCGGSGYMLTYGCFTLLQSRNQHNIAKQLYPKFKKKNSGL